MRRDGYARVVVWAHNSHLGDARATQMGWEGELNVGQLTREKHGDQAVRWVCRASSCRCGEQAMSWRSCASPCWSGPSASSTGRGPSGSRTTSVLSSRSSSMRWHIDRTRAVEPLERVPGWRDAEPPETYPSAL
jgi:hypothetical protein